MCGATMRSVVQPGHTHICNMNHDAGGHKCSDSACRRWFPFPEGEVTMTTKNRAPRAWHIEERFNRFYVVNHFGGFEGWHTTRIAALAAGRAYVAEFGDQFEED